MAFDIIFEKRAKKELLKLSKQKKLLKKVLEIIDNISTDPYSPEYKFERLKYDLAGFCSKRVDAKNRLVYQVIDDVVVVIVISVLGHYEA